MYYYEIESLTQIRYKVKEHSCFCFDAWPVEEYLCTYLVFYSIQNSFFSTVVSNKQNDVVA